MADLPDSTRSIPWIARLLLDTGPGGLALLEGADLVFTYANRAFLDLAAGREVLGRAYAQVWPENAADVLPLVERARRTGRMVEEHDRRLVIRRAPDGDPDFAWLSFSFQPLPGRDGDPSAIALHVMDRTGDVLAREREADLAAEHEMVLQAELMTRATQAAQRIAEEAADAARRKAAELDTVLESIADGLILHDRDGRVVRINPAAQRLLGYTAADLARSYPERVARFAFTGPHGQPLSPDDVPTARALRGEVMRGLEVRHEWRDGSRRPFWASVSAAPILAPGGALHGAVTTLADITPIRELQEQREDLIRAISHDLRTPLTVISAQAQMLARRPDDREVVLRRADALRTSAGRMAAMIDDLVDVSRLEAGKLRLEPRAVPLAPFAHELRERLRGALGVERLRLEVPEDVPPALADPPHLERILVNLITNALKYSPPDAEATLAAAAAGSRVRVTVRDRGPGIPPEELPRLFERFYRSPHSLKAEGLGLGLYITRLLVEAHGGTIRAESDPGHGTAFHVELPAAR